MIDFELEIQHIVYIFMISITWLLISLWGGSVLRALYDPMPLAVGTFIVVSYWVAGGGFALGIGVILFLYFEE